MASFDFPSRQELEGQRRTSEGFQEQVQGLLEKVREDMVRRGPIHENWGYLPFPPNTDKDVREAVRDAINAVNDGRDWDARLATDEGSPVLVVNKRQN